MSSHLSHERIYLSQEEARLPLDEGLHDAVSQEFANAFIDVYKTHCLDMDVLVSSLYGM